MKKNIKTFFVCLLISCGLWVMMQENHPTTVQKKIKPISATNMDTTQGSIQKDREYTYDADDIYTVPYIRQKPLY